jgi:hypothetical protein
MRDEVAKCKDEVVGSGLWRLFCCGQRWKIAPKHTAPCALVWIGLEYIGLTALCKQTWYVSREGPPKRQFKNIFYALISLDYSMLNMRVHCLSHVLNILWQMLKLNIEIYYGTHSTS